MSEETIIRIIRAEQNARAMFTDAQHEVSQYVAETKRQTRSNYEHALVDIQQRAEAIITQGRTIADAKRANLIAHAGADAQSMETMSTQHLDDAVRFVLQALTGQN